MAVAQTTIEQLRSSGLETVDPEIASLLGRELERQRGQIELIASENFTWPSVLEEIGAVVATSANLPGGPDPRRLEEVPDTIRAGAAAVLDAGEVPGTPSTVVDVTGAEPRILREGAVPATEVLRRLQAAVRSS